jgi:predicted nucleotidyltransferase
MKPSEVFAQHRDTIRRLILESGMTNPRLFGSALHGDDTDTSDLDLLIDAPRGKSLFDIVRTQLAIEDCLGIDVHLLTPGDLPPKYRDSVVREALPV